MIKLEEGPARWVDRLRVRYVLALLTVIILMSGMFYAHRLERARVTELIERFKVHENSDAAAASKQIDSLLWLLKSDPEIQGLRSTQLGLSVVTVVVVIGSFIMLFEPVARLLDRQWRQLQESSERLRHALADARVASEHKSRFLANMSHEIRTPMNGIVGLADELQRSELTDTQNQYIRMLKGSADGLLALLNDILDYSKIDAGRVELEPRPNRLSEIAELAVAPFWELAKERNNSIVVDIDSNVPEGVVVDETRLRQVLTNLISNGNKFTNSGRVVLRIEQTAHNGDIRDIQFSVADTGVGIEKAKQAEIFDEFRQADSSITREFGGTGLGLAICKSLVQMMGGKIQLESQPGRGSRFWFVLPLQVTELAERPRVDPSKNTHTVSPRLSVLVAEDGKVNQVVVRLLLEHEGHEVTIVEDGSQVLSEIERGRFDLVLMDIHMPNMDGLEATRRIRALENRALSEIPIIAVTASVMQEERNACLQAGMNDVIAKPIDAREISSLISQHSSLGESPIGWPPAATHIAVGRSR